LAEDKTHGNRRENPMLKPMIEKAVVNVSIGKPGEPLEKASKVLEQLTDQRPCKRKAKKTIRGFGIHKGEPIACLVTLREERARRFLERAFQAIDNRLSKECFDNSGNFAFGIKEHIEIPDTKYRPELGIYGMDVSVTIVRPGYRVKRRRHATSAVGSRHIMTADEAIAFIRDEFGIEIAQ